MELFDESWRKDAYCLGMGPDLFFPVAGGGSPNSDARGLCCAKCQVRLECLEYAWPQDRLMGIWGGVSETERDHMRTRRNSAA